MTYFIFSIIILDIGSQELSYVDDLVMNVGDNISTS